MADNYLEKRYAEVFGPGQKTVVKKTNPSLDSLLLRNRSHRSFLKEHLVRMSELEIIIGVNCKIPSAMNQQVLRFYPATAASPLVSMGDGNSVTASSVLQKAIHLGGALPELHLPTPGAEPEAFIVVCSTAAEGRYVDIDLGISLQSMALKSVEMGLNSIIVCAFDRPALKDALRLPYEPLAILCVGKGQDKIQLLSIEESQNHTYYRKDGIHYVPKVCLKDLLIR